MNRIIKIFLVFQYKIFSSLAIVTFVVGILVTVVMLSWPTVSGKMDTAAKYPIQYMYIVRIVLLSLEILALFISTFVYYKHDFAYSNKSVIR